MDDSGAICTLWLGLWNTYTCNLSIHKPIFIHKSSKRRQSNGHLLLFCSYAETKLSIFSIQRLRSYLRPSYLFLGKNQNRWNDSTVKATCLCIVTFAEDVISISFFGYGMHLWLLTVSPNNRKTAMSCHVIVGSLILMVVQLSCSGAKTMTTWLWSLSVKYVRFITIWICTIFSCNPD